MTYISSCHILHIPGCHAWDYIRNKYLIPSKKVVVFWHNLGKVVVFSTLKIFTSIKYYCHFILPISRLTIYVNHLVYLSTNICCHFRACHSSPAHQLSTVCPRLCQSPDPTPACTPAPHYPIIPTVYVYTCPVASVVCLLGMLPSHNHPLWFVNLPAFVSDFDLW